MNKMLLLINADMRHCYMQHHSALDCKFLEIHVKIALQGDTKFTCICGLGLMSRCVSLESLSCISSLELHEWQLKLQIFWMEVCIIC